MGGTAEAPYFVEGYDSESDRLLIVPNDALEEPKTDIQVNGVFTSQATKDASGLTNLLTNGEFTNWDYQADSWQFGSFDGTHTPTRSTDSHGGSYSVQFNGVTDGGSYIVQFFSVTLDSGDVYTHFWAKNPSGVGTIGLVYLADSGNKVWDFNTNMWVSDEDPRPYAWTVTPTTSWTQFDAPPVPTTEYGDLQVAFISEYTGILVDDCDVLLNDTGPNLLTNGDFEVWTAFQPTGWNVYQSGPGNSAAIVTANSDEYVSAPYSAALTNGPDSGGGNYGQRSIWFTVSGLDLSTQYRLAAYARSLESSGTAGMMAFNGNPDNGGVQVYNWNTQAWVSWDNNFSNTDYNNNFAVNDGDWTLGISPAFYPDSSGTVVVLLKNNSGFPDYTVLFDNARYGVPQTLTVFEVTNPSDSSQLGANDVMFNFKTTGGTPKNFLTQTGDGVLHTDFDAFMFGGNVRFQDGVASEGAVAEISLNETNGWEFHSNEKAVMETHAYYDSDNDDERAAYLLSAGFFETGRDMVYFGSSFAESNAGFTWNINLPNSTVHDKEFDISFTSGPNTPVPFFQARVSGASSGVLGDPMVSINPTGLPLNFVAWGSSVVSLLFVDGNDNRVGFGAAPNYPFDVEPIASTNKALGTFHYLTPATDSRTSNTEVIGTYFQQGGIQSWEDGVVTLQREYVFEAPTYDMASSGNINVAVTMYVGGNPMGGSNVAIGETAALVAGDVFGDAYYEDKVESFIAVMPGIHAGAGNVTRRAAMAFFSKTDGSVPMGDQTAELDTFAAAIFGQATLVGTDGLRTVFNPHTVIIEGSPVNGPNVAFAKEAHSLHINQGNSYFGGSVQLYSGAVPHGVTTDVAELFGVDNSAGHTTLGVYTEETVQTDIGIVSTDSIIIQWNGAKYKIPLVAV